MQFAFFVMQLDFKVSFALKKTDFFFNWFNFLLFFGLDRIYQSWWFILLLIFLVISLTSCTITRQFPLVKNSKKDIKLKDKMMYRNYKN